MQPAEAGEPSQLGNSSPVSWVVGLRMGGGNALSSEAAEEVQSSSTASMRCSSGSKTSQGSVVIQGPWMWLICHRKVTAMPP